MIECPFSSREHAPGSRLESTWCSHDSNPVLVWKNVSRLPTTNRAA
jgi:hypothetical protein